MARVGRWVHVKRPHPQHKASAHYSAAGRWVCFTCREPVKLRGT